MDTGGKVAGGHEADCSPPSIAKVKNAWSYTSTPQYIIMVSFLIKQCIYIFMAWYLFKHRDGFTFTITKEQITK
jgi:hypothetical protein